MVWPIRQLIEWRERQSAMREIRRIADAEVEQMTYDDSNPVNLAKIALTLNDPAVALTHWRNVMTRAPLFAKTHKDAPEILIGLKLYDEAETIMRECMRRYPAEARYAGCYAQVAEERRDHAEATARWKNVINRFPSWWKGYVHYATSLSATGQHQEADKVLTKAVAQFPDEVIAGIEWARNAERQKDHAESLARWQKLWDRTQHPVAISGVARALITLGRLDEAETRLLEARTRHPLAEAIRIDLAQLAEKRGDTDEALRRWVELKTRMPLLRFGYEGEFRLLRKLGRLDEAGAVIEEAVERFPHDAWPVQERETNDRLRPQAPRQASGDPS
jgi:tetratricopeptide (TPR) repeat protein